MGTQVQSPGATLSPLEKKNGVRALRRTETASLHQCRSCNAPSVLTGFSGSQTGRLFDETVHQGKALRGGLEVAIPWSFELLSKRFDILFVQAQVVQSIGGSLE